MKSSLIDDGPGRSSYLLTRSHPPGLGAPRAARAARAAALQPGNAGFTLATRASVNLRHHMLRAVLRMTALLVCDAGAFLVLRSLMRAARQWQALDVGQLGFLRWLFAQGYLGGWQFAAALIVGLALTGAYGPGDNRRMPGRLFMATAVGTALPLWASLWSQPILLVASRYLATVPPTFAALLTLRLALDRLILRVAPHPHAAGLARTVLVGREADCTEMRASSRTSAEMGFAILGYVDSENPTAPGALGGLADLPRILAAQRAETVILCGAHDDGIVRRVVRAATMAECQVITSAPLHFLAGVRPQVLWRRGQPFITLRSVGLRWPELALKRALDIGIASIGLVVLSPALLLVAIAIRLEGPGPVIFRQKRLGRHGRVFECLKFRSMCDGAEARLREDALLYRIYVQQGYKLPEHLDTRITRVGRLLRRTSLDELPQLWNVLRGDMSLVGPRPVVPDEIRQYEEQGPLLLTSRPGMTGEWQVNGRSALTYPGRAEVELQYVERWTLLRDLVILLRTLPAVLARRGAH